MLVVTFAMTYLKGYGEKKAYIASQGPKDINVIDFWKLIWEQNVRTIVMLTRVVEASKVLHTLPNMVMQAKMGIVIYM